jgi:hypothetical protein
MASDAEGNSDAQTFLNVAVDAVVPFLTTLSEQIFYLIYENISSERQTSFEFAVIPPFTSPFLEILLERIISPNAP